MSRKTSQYLYRLGRKSKERIEILKSVKGKQCKYLSNFEYGLKKRFSIKKFGSEEVLIRQPDEKSKKKKIRMRTI